jgi:hypothetical protein
VKAKLLVTRNYSKLFISLCSLCIAAFISVSIPASGAEIKSGATCLKKGLIKVVAGKKFTCLQSGKKLIWSKGAVITSPTPKISPTPSPIGPPFSVLTRPPGSMIDINNNSQFFTTGLDPNFVTLGPKLGNRPELPSYPGQSGLVVELADGAPVLAPLDMQFIGFNNRNSEVRITSTGVHQIPYDDLELCFESTDSNWPGMIFCIYHQQNSPLISAINLNPLCGTAEQWPGPLRAEGRQFFSDADTTQPTSETSKSCKALLNRKVSRGSVIGYAGSVGPHSQSPIRIKVRDKSINPTTMKGDRNLHWVQPDVFFYWKCYSPKATFPPGVLAYPFECNGYGVPNEQLSIDFKY